MLNVGTGTAKTNQTHIDAVSLGIQFLLDIPVASLSLQIVRRCLVSIVISETLAPVCAFNTLYYFSFIKHLNF